MIRCERFELLIGGYPAEVSASWLASRSIFEILFWLNPSGAGIAQGAPCAHKTLHLTPTQWLALREQLIAYIGQPAPAPLALLEVMR